MWKNLWCNVFVLALLFLMSGCLGHSVETSGDDYMREYGDMEFENDRGIQNITVNVYASSENATSSQQKTNSKQSAEADANLGLNGGAASKGDGAMSTGLQTLDYLLKAGTEDAISPPAAVVPIVKPTPPVVKPEIPVGSSVEVLRYNGRANGSGDGSGDDPLDRPTWYAEDTLKSYPAAIRVNIQGCVDRIVDISGNRPNGTPGYEGDGLIVKQSDVSGRGMAVIFSSSCMSKTAAIEY